MRDGGLPEDSRFTRDRVIATLGEEAGAKTWGEIEQAKALGDQMAAIRWATLGEIAERMSGLETDAAQPKAAGLLALAVEWRDRQLRDQPADYALANPHIAELHGAMVQAMAQPQLPPALAANLPSQDDRRAATAAYANATLAEQERLGVPEDARQVLPEAMAQEIAAGLVTSDPAKADQTLRDLAKDWGEAWPRVLDDLKRAGLPPEHAALAAAKNPVSRQTLAEVMAIQTDEPGALRAKTGADADGIDDLVYRHTAGPDGRLLSDDHIKLVKLVAYHHARFSEPEEAVRRALADITGDIILTAGSEGKSEGIMQADLVLLEGQQSSQVTPVATEAGKAANSEPVRQKGGMKREEGDSTKVLIIRSKEPQPPKVQPQSLIDAQRRNNLKSEWRERLARYETGGKPYNGYGTYRIDPEEQGYALGRYQMRKPGLIESGMMDREGMWVGKYGIYSAEDFMNNPQAQEAALFDLSEAIEQRYIDKLHTKNIGRKITTNEGVITVGRGGFVGAAHEAGPTKMREYFRWMDRNKGVSKGKQLPRGYAAIERRLKEFENIPYR